MKLSCARDCSPSLPPCFPFHSKPWCSFTARPTPSHPFPDLHPSSCPLRRLSGSPSSESKASRSPCRTMRPAVSEQPGWPTGLGFSRAAGAGGCPGQQRAGGGQSGESAARGLVRPSLRKQEQTPGRQPRQRRASEQQEDEEGVCAARVLGQKDFTLTRSPCREPEGTAGG